ncbi:hypothetical protein WDU94_002722 [Cyamophila willieti]
MDELLAAQNDDLESAAPEIWTDYVGRHKSFEFTGLSGLQVDIPDSDTPLQVFDKIVDKDILEFIANETNRYAQIQYARVQPTDAEEMKKFVILTIWMGLVPIGRLCDYWCTASLVYKFERPREMMSRTPYQLLLSMIHFANNDTIRKGDRLGKIQPLIDKLERKYQELYVPSENFVIDESLVPWRGRLIFRQYIPNKAHRYGIKLFKLCSTDGYTWSLKVYSGKSSTGEREIGLAENVCFQLSEKLLDQGRTLYIDNFYTSVDIARNMLDRNTHVVGTVRANRRNLPKDITQAKIKRGQLISKEDAYGIVILKWRDTRDVDD